MNLVYKGNTFMKDGEERQIVRVGKKEYRFEKGKVDLERCSGLIRHFAEPASAESLTERGDREELKMLYLLIRIGALAEVEPGFEPTPLNMYILRNYADYAEVIRRCENTAALEVKMVDSAEALALLHFKRQCCIVTSVFEENVVAIVKNEEELERLAQELRRKKMKTTANPKIERLLRSYTEILAIDAMSLYPKYENAFVLTMDLQMINYTPFDSRHAGKRQLPETAESRETYVSDWLGYLNDHPSFFLTYEIERDSAGLYGGIAYKRGYMDEPKTYREADFMTVLERILQDVLPDVIEKSGEQLLGLSREKEGVDCA